MNGVHDMGGMQGMGPVEHERNEPVFHAPWEARACALSLAMGYWRKWNLDASRSAREKIPAAEYLRLNYYEKWIMALVEQSVEGGLVTRAELASGQPALGSTKATPPLTVEMVPDVIAKGGSARRNVRVAARFKTGERVRARNMNPRGHTRLPRYARGKEGTIHADHGVFVFPDTNSAFLGEKPQHVYSVRFSALELWGEQASARDTVNIDLWDDYLEHA
jgi:nitrile hydratase beta subunit